MKLYLVSYTTAKLAKEKGFGLSEDCFIDLPYYYNNSGLLENEGKITSYVSKIPRKTHLGADTIEDFKSIVVLMDNSLDDYILAPEQELLRKWLRDVHKIYVDIGVWGGVEFGYTVVSKRLIIESKEFESIYEQALEAGLQEALNLIP